MRSARTLRVKPAASLPAQLTTFVGRRSAIELVSQRLAENWLVSIVGPGGCGKTRLAIEVCRQTTVVPSDRVFFIDFSGLSDPALVPGAVLRALGLQEAPSQSPLETLTARLSETELLVLLDNCEHVVPACAELAIVLGGNCPGVRLLATSRENLGVAGETVVEVGGLELPQRAGCIDEDGLLLSEAGRLFIERARMARADFAVDAADAPVVAGICERLDGIPLAIEMAAARARIMSVRAIHDGLTDRFSLLTGTEHSGPSRHRTLLASIEWSCGLLGTGERHLLHRLSVFASGFTLSAVKSVCAGDEIERSSVLALLTSLVNRSLVQALPGADRFRLHETLHAYAAGGLESEEATAVVRDRHLDYFTAMAKLLEPKTRTSDLPLARSELEPELDNLRAALRWSVESRQFDTGAVLLSSLGNFLLALGLGSEALAHCWPFLAAEVQPCGRADILELAARCSRYKDPALSLRLASELVSLGQSLGDESIHVRGLLWAASVQGLANPGEAVEAATEAIRVGRAGGQPVLELLGLEARGWALNSLNRPAEALMAGEEALQVSESLDWPRGEANARGLMAFSAMLTGHLVRALDEANELIRVSQHLEPLFRANGESLRAEVLWRLGQTDQAVDSIGRALSLSSASEYTYFVLNQEVVQGLILVSTGRQDKGYEVLEAATLELESFGFHAAYVECRAVLAEVAIRRGDLPTARRHLDASSWKLPRGPEPAGAPIFRAEARLARAEGQLGRAHALACDGLAAAFDGGHMLWVIGLLELVAVTCADLGRHEEAARLLGAAELQRETTGYDRSTPIRDELGPVLDDARTALGFELFEQMMSEGRALPLEDAVAYARRGRGSHSHVSSGWDSLTSSERRVVSLVAQHLTNAEVAQQLFISVDTVKSHLNRAFAKLGIANRRQLPAIVHRLDEGP